MQSSLFTLDQDARVLTVRQPWAWAIIHAGKDVENRTRPTRYRGLLLIHAGQADDPAGHEFLAQLGLQVPERLDHGVIIGSVQLVDSVQASTSRWAFPGSHHWRLADPVPAVSTLACRGQLGLFRPPAGWAGVLG
jgi:hypothetical protein